MLRIIRLVRNTVLCTLLRTVVPKFINNYIYLELHRNSWRPSLLGWRPVLCTCGDGRTQVSLALCLDNGVMVSSWTESKRESILFY